MKSFKVLLVLKTIPFQKTDQYDFIICKHINISHSHKPFRRFKLTATVVLDLRVDSLLFL